MDPRLEGLLRILDLNTRLFKTCLEDISDETAHKKPNSETNSVAFLVCHLVDARSYLSKLLGLQEGTGVHGIFPSYAALVEHQDEPPIADIVFAWDGVTELLRPRIIELRSEELDADCPESFPIEDPTLFGAIAFLLHHEAYHIGQIAFARKFFGVGTMRYGHKALLSRV